MVVYICFDFHLLREHILLTTISNCQQKNMNNSHTSFHTQRTDGIENQHHRLLFPEVW